MSCFCSQGLHIYGHSVLTYVMIGVSSHCKIRDSHRTPRARTYRLLGLNQSPVLLKPEVKQLKREPDRCSEWMEVSRISPQFPLNDAVIWSSGTQTSTLCVPPVTLSKIHTSSSVVKQTWFYNYVNFNITFIINKRA